MQKKMDKVDWAHPWITFLKPVVDDLITLWNGVPLHSRSDMVIKGALILV